MTAARRDASRSATHDRLALPGHLDRWEDLTWRPGALALELPPGLAAGPGRGLRSGSLNAWRPVEGERTRGLLPLAYVRSLLFGRFLVSLPYLNYGGVMADDEATGRLLIDRAVGSGRRARRAPPGAAARTGRRPPDARAAPGGQGPHAASPAGDRRGALWRLRPLKVRNQVRKGQKADLTVAWGGEELLPDFYEVFSQNMRDLGTPVFGRSLFRAIAPPVPGPRRVLRGPRRARPVAAALLLHGWGITEVPSASSLREFNSTCCNMLMYLEPAGAGDRPGPGDLRFRPFQPDSGTYHFKKQWGAPPAGRVAVLRPGRERLGHEAGQSEV